MTGITFDAERLREIGERYGVARLEVFGSVGRGEERGSSDLDLLSELKPGARWGFALRRCGTGSPRSDRSVVVGAVAIRG